MKQKIDEIKRQTTRETKAAVQAARQHNEAFTDTLRQTLKRRDEAHRETSGKLEASQRLFQKKVRSLDERAATLSRRFDSLSTRRGMEAEGYLNEITILKRMLRDAENNLFKLKNPYHGVEMGMLASTMETAGQTMKIREDLKNIKSRLGELERIDSR